MVETSERVQIEPELIDSTELARMLSVSKKWVEKHRNRIIGSIKMAGVWRFRVQMIRARLAAGRDIVEK
ncbi:MAG: hypothetical protein ACLFVE_15090 [Chitinispirillaceae bacterium]